MLVSGEANLSTQYAVQLTEPSAKEGMLSFESSGRRRLRMTLVFFGWCLGSRALAQSLASPFSSVSQTVDNTTIKLDYYRPAARERQIFGGIVRWEVPWTPGANWATTLEVSADVSLEGRLLPKGKYSIWFIPRRDSTWSVRINPIANIYHLYPPLDSDQLLLEATPFAVPHTEVLTWSFPRVMRDATLLQFAWGSTGLSFHVAISPTSISELDQLERRAYLGRWDLLSLQTGARHRVEVVEDKGTLQLRGVALRDRFDSVVDLVSIGGSHFHPRHYTSGAPTQSDRFITIVFTIEDDRAVRFEVRGRDDAPLMRASRPS